MAECHCVVVIDKGHGARHLFKPQCLCLHVGQTCSACEAPQASGSSPWSFTRPSEFAPSRRALASWPWPCKSSTAFFCRLCFIFVVVFIIYIKCRLAYNLECFFPVYSLWSGVCVDNTGGEYHFLEDTSIAFERHHSINTHTLG